MPYKPLDEKTLGIWFDEEVLQAAYVIAEKGRIKIAKLFEKNIPFAGLESEDVKPLYMDESGKELKKILTEHLTVTALNTQDVLVRRLRLKLVKEKDINEAFAFQAEPLLPFPLEAAVIDKIIAEKQEGSSLITLVAAKKDYIKKHLESCQNFEIDPEAIASVPNALSSFSGQFSTSSGPLFVVHIGPGYTTCILTKQDKLLASHTSSSGFRSFLAAFHQDFPDLKPPASSLYQIDFTKIDSEKEKHLFEHFKNFTQDIQWKYLAELKETKLKEPIQLLILGQGANLFHLPEAIASALQLPLASLANTESFQPYTEADAKHFAVPIGLALSFQPSSSAQINFRRQEFAFSNPWKRFQKPILIYAGLCLALALSFYIFSKSYLSYRQDELKSHYLSMLALIQKPYDEFEKQYEAKFPQEKKNDETLLSIQELDQEGLEKRLDFLDKEIRAMPDTFPLLPNTPRVSDVLAWISTHPKIICSEESKENGECPVFQIENFSYTMVKRPELNKKTERYQVKVDLEFSTSSPRLAREFHDALIAPNDFVDPKGEIKWNATKGKYKTSFYLKDKTYYPAPLKE